MRCRCSRSRESEAIQGEYPSALYTRSAYTSFSQSGFQSKQTKTLGSKSASYAPKWIRPPQKREQQSYSGRSNQTENEETFKIWR